MENRFFIKIAFRTLLGLAILLPQKAYSQNQQNSFQRQQLETRYLDGISSIIGAKIPTNEFEVNVTVVEQKSLLADQGYFSSGLSNQAISLLPFHQLRDYVTSLKIDVALSPKYGDPAKSWVRNTLTKRLFLRPESDQITFSLQSFTAESVNQNNPNAKLATENADAQRKLIALESARIAAETKARDLESASRDFKARLDQQQQENSKLSIMLETARNAGTSAKSVISSIWDAQNARNRYIVFGIAIVFAIAFAGIALAMLGSSKRLGEALKSGLGAIGQAFRREEAVASESYGRGERMGSTLPGATIDESGRTDLTSLPQVYELVSQLGKELVGMISESKEPHVVDHVTWLLRSGEGDKSIGKAVAALELLGPQLARKFFDRLKTEEQMKVLEFLRKGVYVTPKPILMLEAGEELKTRLLGLQDSADGTFGASPARSTLSQLEDDDVLKLTRQLDAQDGARLLCLLDPVRSGRIIAQLKESKDPKFTAIIENLPGLVEITSFTEIDNRISAAAKKFQSADAKDRRDAVLPFYKNLLTHVEDDVAEMIISSLRRDPYFEEKIASRHLSVATFFELALELRFDVLTRLTPREIASFCFILPENRQRVVFESLSERRKETVGEDLEEMRANSVTGAKAARDARIARQKIVNILREMERDGVDLKLNDKNTTSDLPRSSNLGRVA